MTRYICVFIAITALAIEFTSKAMAQTGIELLPKKLIATGWDSPTPKNFRKYIADFERWPFDGTTVQLERAMNNGKITENASFGFSREHWQRNDFDQTVIDLQATRPKKCFDNFILFSANPGGVDWFDDTGWKEIIDHWRLVAEVARAGKMKGILFDTEPYVPPEEQFNYVRQPAQGKHTFAEYNQKARERGRQVMGAITSVFPNITIMTYRLLCDQIAGSLATVGDSTSLLARDPFGLVPAFLDGWLDVMPLTVTLIEGDEVAYSYNDVASYQAAFTHLKLNALAFVSPENREKLYKQCQISHGIYLDAFENPVTDKWHINTFGTAPASRLEVNVASALKAANEYVWIYGEKGRWWPSGDKQYPIWPAKMPGVARALLAAKDPQGAAEIILSSASAGSNLLGDPEFLERTQDGRPQAWPFVQGIKSHGSYFQESLTRASNKGSARAQRIADGYFYQTIPVHEGDAYALRVGIRRKGAGYAAILVSWKDSTGAALEGSQSVLFMPPIDTDADGWCVCIGYVVVPRAAKMIFQLVVRDQVSNDDVVWFSDAKVVQGPWN